MNKRKLEALAEARVRYSGYLNADNSLYAARNPGGLVAFSSTQTKDEQGFRTFRSMLDGMQALLFDVELKMAGRSRAALSPESTLTDFAEACGQQATAAVAWASFLRKALRDTNISQKTTIAYFIGDTDGI